MEIKSCGYTLSKCYILSPLLLRHIWGHPESYQLEGVYKPPWSIYILYED